MLLLHAERGHEFLKRTAISNPVTMVGGGATFPILHTGANFESGRAGSRNAGNQMREGEAQNLPAFIEIEDIWKLAKTTMAMGSLPNSSW